jgi:hypothetical protein
MLKTPSKVHSSDVLFPPACPAARRVISFSKLPYWPLPNIHFHRPAPRQIGVSTTRLINGKRSVACSQELPASFDIDFLRFCVKMCKINLSHLAPQVLPETCSTVCVTWICPKSSLSDLLPSLLTAAVLTAVDSECLVPLCSIF